ncbi:LysM peptidoglycan-binding domain-containing protein [Microcoleus sp. F8-D3]
MSINEIDPANSLKTKVDSFTALLGSISDINRDLFRPLSNAPNSALRGIPMNPLLELDDRTLSAIQTKARSGASSVYGNESEIFPIDRGAQQVSKALMDNAITAPVPIGDRVDRIEPYDELLNPNPSNLAATVLSQKGLGTGNDWSELQKADGNGFTERVAYQLPSEKYPGKEVYVVKEGDTLWDIAEAKLGDGNRWKELQKADGKGFTEQEAYKLAIGTEVYIPESVIVNDDGTISIDTTKVPNGEGIGRNKEEGNALRDRWVKYYEECEDAEVWIEARWIDPNTNKQMTFPPELNDPEDPGATWRAGDIVTISGGTVTVIEVKTTAEEAGKNRSKRQEARDDYAIANNGQVRGPDGKLYTPTKVDRVQGEPPDCPPDESDEAERKRKKPETNPPAENVDPPARPRTAPPLEAPARPRTAPPLEAPARPARPPIDDAPVRPPASTSLLNGASRVARPLAVVTDVIDLKNAYDRDGGFGQNFQETAGSVAGGWGGAAAGAAGGAAIGSLAGPVGTVVGGIAGGIIGGIGGSAAGEGIVKGIRDFFG